MHCEGDIGSFARLCGVGRPVLPEPYMGEDYSLKYFLNGCSRTAVAVVQEKGRDTSNIYGFGDPKTGFASLENFDAGGYDDAYNLRLGLYLNKHYEGINYSFKKVKILELRHTCSCCHWIRRAGNDA